MWVCVCLCSSLSCLTGSLGVLSWLSSACVNPDTLCPYPSPICTGGQRSHGTASSFSFAVSANPQRERNALLSLAIPPHHVTLAVNSKVQSWLSWSSVHKHRVSANWFDLRPPWALLNNSTAGQAPSALPKLQKYHQVGFWFDNPSIFSGLDFDCSSLPFCALEPVLLSMWSNYLMCLILQTKMVITERNNVK